VPCPFPYRFPVRDIINNLKSRSGLKWHVIRSGTAAPCRHIMIRTTHLRKTYRADGIETVALSDVSIQISHGEFVAVTGPSGCGKSSLLNILGLIDKPDGGAYHFDGTATAGFSEGQRAQLRKQHIGFVFQSFNLINELTIYENVELPLLYIKMKQRDRKERVLYLLDQMNLSHRRHHYPQQLSGGQQQRVAVARAISNNPKLILADEPTGNLDTRSGDEVLNQLLQLNQQGTTVVMVTHSLHYVRYCGRTISLLDGQVFTEQTMPLYV